MNESDRVSNEGSKQDLWWLMLFIRLFELTSFGFYDIRTVYNQIKLMIRRYKWLLRFSIIYWLVITLGIVLNALTLKKVPI